MSLDPIYFGQNQAAIKIDKYMIYKYLLDYLEICLDQIGI